MSEILCEKDFNSFVRSMLNGEVINEIKFDKPDDFKIADYFFDNRAIIGELKCLENDMKEKFQTFVDKKSEEGVLPVFYGEAVFEKLLSSIPSDKREVIKREAFEAITSSFENAFEHANRQIRDTRKMFNLPKSSGFVILANNGNIMLDPKFAIYKIQHLMNKRRDGKIRYENINFGVYISMRHYTDIKEGQRLFPIISFINNKLREPDEQEYDFIESFQRQYAAYKKMPIYLPKNLKIQDAVKFPFGAE